MASRTSTSRQCGTWARSTRPIFAESLESRTLLSTYSLQTLIALGGNSGVAATNGSLLVTPNDAVYGTTQRGGIDVSGSIFVFSRGAFQFTPLAIFSGLHGSDPVGGLVMDAAGNLFGTTVYTTSVLAGNNPRFNGALGAGDGTVYELPKGNLAITTLATFDGSNGQSPQGTLVIDSSGNLFGTTRAGGASGQGTVFEVPAGSGTISTLASFNGANGSNPFAPLLLDSAGNLFGVTPTGGASGNGTAFEIPAGGTLTTLVSFNGANGASPSGGLVQDASGNLFGNAAAGGANGQGEVYEIASGSGAITPVASFAGIDGSDPQGQVAIDSSGNLFGTAHLNGAADDGTAFEISAGTNAITTIAAFNAANGSLPEGLTPDGNGNYFTITTAAGAFGLGTLDRLLQGGTANAPGRFTAIMGRTTLPPAVIGGQIVDSFVTVGMADVLSVNGSVTVRLYASTDNAIDASSVLIRTYAFPENFPSGVRFAVQVPILSIPTTVPSGSYRLLAQATDPVGNVATTPSGPSVRIAVPSVSFSGSFTRISLPAESIGGTRTPAQAFIRLANNGNYPSFGLITVTLYLSPDGTLASGIPIRATGRFPYLFPGGAIGFNVPLLDIPPGLAGMYYLVAQIAGRTGATATIVSDSTYSIIPGAATISARIDSFQPTTVNPASRARASLSLTLTNTGNLPAGGTANPFILALGLTSPDGTQTLPLQAFTSALLLNPGKSRTLRLFFPQSLFAPIAAGSWIPTLTVNPISGSSAASAFGPTAITIP